jgi:hypothetical protein
VTLRGTATIRRAGLLAGACTLLAPAAAYAWHEQAPPGSVVPVAFGDIAKVSGAPIGCIVRRQSGEAALDCRRAGDLTGTYGTILTKTQVLVVRFESSKVAKIVFQARHRQLRTHTCGG